MLSHPFPRVKQEIKEEYRSLVHDIDNLVEELINDYIRKPMACRPGCDECCMAFSVLAIEAALISSELPGEEIVLLHEKRCKFLGDKRCTIYELRPIICRTQGLPIGYINDESGVVEVSACPVNFPEDYQFHQEELLYMDKLNSRLSAINNKYCTGVGIDPLERITLNSL